jgi:hypothetical protein
MAGIAQDFAMGKLLIVSVINRDSHFCILSVAALCLIVGGVSGEEFRSMLLFLFVPMILIT